MREIYKANGGWFGVVLLLIILSFLTLVPLAALPWYWKLAACSVGIFAYMTPHSKY